MTDAIFEKPESRAARTRSARSCSHCWRMRKRKRMNCWMRMKCRPRLHRAVPGSPPLLPDRGAPFGSACCKHSECRQNVRTSASSAGKVPASLAMSKFGWTRCDWHVCFLRSLRLQLLCSGCLECLRMQVGRRVLANSINTACEAWKACRCTNAGVEPPTIRGLAYLLNITACHCAILAVLPSKVHRKSNPDPRCFRNFTSPIS